MNAPYFIQYLLLPITFLTITVAGFSQNALTISGYLDQVGSKESDLSSAEIILKSDSLLHLKDITLHDSLLVYSYTGMQLKIKRDYEDALEFYRKINEADITFSKEVFNDKVAESYSQMAQCYLRTGKQDSAIWASKKSLLWYQSSSFPQGLAINYHRLAIIYKNIGLPDSNEYYLNKGLQIASEANDSVGIGNYKMALGVMYLDKRNYAKSVENLLESLEIGIAIDDLHIQTRTLDKLAIYYETIGDYNKQKYYIDQQLKMAEEAKEVKSFGAAAANAANYYKRIKAYDSAFYYIDQSIAFFNQIKLTNKMLIEMNKKANLLYQTERYSESAMLYQDVVEKSNDIYKGPSALAYLGLSKIALKQNDVKAAEKYALKAKSLQPEKKGSLDIQQEVNLALYQSYKEQGKNDLALSSLEKVYTSTKLSKEKRSKLEIARIEYNYQLKEKQKEFATHQVEQALVHQNQIDETKATMNIFMLFGIFTTLLLTVSFIAQKRKKKDNLLLSHQAMELHQKNEELEALHESKNELLKENIDEKERRIAAITMSQFENQKTLSKIEDQIEELISSGKNISPQELSRVRSLIKSYAGNESSWDSFVHQFEQVNPNFFTQLKATYPLITVNDLKTCAYLKIGMDNKSIAQVTNASPNTVKSRIHRLKKKMNLAPEESIRDLMMSL